VRVLPLLLSLLLRTGSAFAASPWTPEPAPVGWSATEASFRVVIRDGEPVRVEGRYRLDTPDARAALLRLVGPELLVTDVSGPVAATPTGLELALGPDGRHHEQAFTGLYTPPSAGRMQLSVLRAPRTRVEVDAPGLDVEIVGAVDGWLAATDRIEVSWRPHVARGEGREPLLMQGDASHAFRGAEDGLRVDSLLRWRILRGSAARLTFDAAGLDELEVTGAAVASWRKEGSRVIIEPRGEATGLFVVRVAGRVAIGKDERTVPTPEPGGVIRTDRYVTMYRSDLGELIPTQMPTSVPLAALPAWAANLADGVPLAAWHGPQPVRVLGNSADTLQGPDTVVTQARYILATAQEGRAGLRMVLRVRNERRQYLRVQPPPGWKPVVVRVGNQPVSWLSDGAGGLYIPLEKSIETVRGLLSFPVDVEWVARDLAPWARKGDMTLTVPSLDAPVQQAEWEVHLPRGYKAIRPPAPGRDRVLLATDLRDELVEEETEAQAARRARIDTVSSALDNASSAYKDNDFHTAQRWLDAARAVDESNEEVALLQENLDVLTGSSMKNDKASRRVKELAKAKTSGKAAQQQVVEKEAEYAYRSGDYERAEQKLEEALALATELQQTEQQESVEQTTRIADAKARLEEVRAQRDANAPANGVGDVVGWGGLGSLGARGEGQGGGAGLGSGRGSGGGSFGGENAEVPSDAPEYDNFADYEGIADALAVTADGEVAGSEGEGVVGGVLSGVMAGAAGAAAAGDDDEADRAVARDRRTSSRILLETEAITALPTGREFESVVDKAPGAWEDEELAQAPPPAEPTPEVSRMTISQERRQNVPRSRADEGAARTAGGKKGEMKPAEERAEKAPAPRPTARANREQAEAVVVSKSVEPVFGLKKKAAPSSPPPPPAPPTPPAARAEPTPAAAAPAPVQAPTTPAHGGPETLGYLDQGIVATFGDGVDTTGEASGTEATGQRGPAGGPVAGPGPPPPPPLPARPAPLEASPAPMALALPLDGPTLTTTQALLPAGEFPEFYLRYRSTLKENP
jgi:hypothetical protein